MTLTNEPEVIFVVYFFKTVEGKDDLAKANDSLRNKLLVELAGYDEVTIANVDLTPKPADKSGAAGAGSTGAAGGAGAAASTAPKTEAAPQLTYEGLAKDNMGIDLTLLEQGPIVAVLKNGIIWI